MPDERCLSSYDTLISGGYVRSAMLRYDQTTPALLMDASAPWNTIKSYMANRNTTLAIYLPDLSGGGVERMRLVLADEFLRLGFDVTLLLSVLRGELRDAIPAGVKVIELSGHRTMADILPLTRYLRSAKPDILLSSLDHNNIAALIAGGLAGTKTKVIICQHNALSSEARMHKSWKYRLVPSAYRLLKSRAAAIVAVSNGVADDLSRISHVHRDRISVIYNPVIDSGFKSRLTEMLTHRWLSDAGLRVFVAAGRLTPQKDFVTLLRAFSLFVTRQAAKGDHSNRLLILGSGEQLGALNDLARKLGIEGVIEFQSFQQNPLPFMRQAAAFILSSRYEGFGNVVVEALGCGTPVISTDCPHGPAEILENGKHGILVPVGDPSAMAEAMTASLNRTWSRDSLRARAGVFSAAAASSGYADLFNRVNPS